jgi:polyisoprenoid-binding protein YceI/dipeptidyl aminopeptidase/acylaminoacyl peptidase
VGAAVVVGVPLVAYGAVAFTNRSAPAPAALDGAPEAATAGPDSLDGDWVVADVSTNFVGYRIRERIGPIAAPSDAVGRTTAVEGMARIGDGRLAVLDVTVDMSSIESDSARRDDFVREEALDVAEFPTGHVSLPEPVPIDAPQDRDAIVELSVPAELTLRDQTREVVFAVTARWNGPTIQVAGSTEIQRSDFGVDVSSRAGFNIDEVGTIEFELTFVPEGGAASTPLPTLVDNPATATDEGVLDLPCRSHDPALRLDPPVLVAATAPDSGSTRFAVVAGAGAVTTVQPVGGLSGGASWSPDGGRLVYSASATVDQPRTLAVVPAAGGTPTPIPGPIDAVQPDWGPDDRIVYVQRGGDGGEDSDIWAVRPDGTEARALVETPGVDSDPRWSPDGRTVVFVTTDGVNNQDVVVVGGDGRGLRTLVGGTAYDYAPSFTAGGERVLFVRDGAIYEIGLDGEDERRLTDGPDDAYPALSPNGGRLAFIRGGSLYVAEADGSSPTCVETGHSVDAAPRWRPW